RHASCLPTCHRNAATLGSRAWPRARETALRLRCSISRFRTAGCAKRREDRLKARQQGLDPEEGEKDEKEQRRRLAWKAAARTGTSGAACGFHVFAALAVAQAVKPAEPRFVSAFLAVFATPAHCRQFTQISAIALPAPRPCPRPERFPASCRSARRGRERAADRT